MLAFMCKKNGWGLFLALVVYFMSATENNSHALSCTPNNSVWVMDVWAFEIDRSANISIEYPTLYMFCIGNVGYKEAMKIANVTLNAKLIDAGFTESTLRVGSETFAYPFTESFNKCIWPDVDCLSLTGRGSVPPLILTLKRAGRGKNVSLVAGDVLAKIDFINRRYGNWYRELPSFEYRIRGSLTPTYYTCGVTESIASVKMPTLDAVEIKNGARGKLTSTKKSFNFRLTCRNGTIVYLQFDGDTLSGTGSDSVLKNRLPRNENLGIQLFDGNTPITIGDKRLITDNAETFVDLAYDAYYYYKGGDVDGGPFKAQITFTFTYE